MSPQPGKEQVRPMSALVPISTPVVLGASTVFSWFGLLYFGTPVLVLVLASICFSTRNCKVFWLLVCGASCAIAALAVAIGSLFGDPRSPLSDGQQALLANIIVCAASIVGVLGCRVVHDLVRKLRGRRCLSDSSALPH